MWMKQLDTLGLASISRQIRLCGELCVHSRAPKASHDRMRRQWRRALLFNRLLLFRCHCNVIKCVSPCQKDLNLSGGFYCLIQHKFPGSWSKENINDLISERSVSLVSHLPTRAICLFTRFSLLSSRAFRTQSQHPKAFWRYDFYRVWIHSSVIAIANGSSWCSLALFLICAPQVRPRPRDLLVRFHWRAGLPERPRHPVKRLLPHRHRHPLPRQPTRPVVPGVRMKGG